MILWCALPFISRATIFKAEMEIKVCFYMRTNSNTAVTGETTGEEQIEPPWMF